VHKPSRIVLQFVSSWQFAQALFIWRSAVPVASPVNHRRRGEWCIADLLCGLSASSQRGAVVLALQVLDEKGLDFGQALAVVLLMAIAKGIG
jgi:hypothetical protein